MTRRLFPWHLSVRACLNRGIVLLVLALFFGAGVVPAHAQPTDSTQLKRFQRADAYVRAGQFDRAIQLLETLYEEAPHNTAFYRKLKEAYESVKRYDDALRLVEDRIERGATPALLSEKARLLHLKGEEEAAEKTWDRALALAPNRLRTYRTVYQTLVNLRRFRKAIDVLRQGREALGRPDAFQTELARLYSLDGQHEKAMQEYVALLADNPQRATFVRNRLQTFVEQGEGIEASIEVLEGAVQESPLNRAYRELLAWLHMEQNDYEAAFDVYRAIDRLEETGGRVLFRFAQRATDARKYGVATEALETVLDRYSGSGIAPEAQQALGHAYRQWAQASSPPQDTSRYDRARAAYRTFLQTYPGHQNYPQVLLRLGTLQLDVYRALGEAETTLRQLLENHSETTAAEEGQYHLARIALFRGNLDRARVFFARLTSTARSSDLASRARYELALLHFYQGEFDSALARTKAISENAAADVTNDAIELKVLLQENRGPDSLDTALRAFARTRLYDRQRRYGKALAQLDTLLQNHPRHPLVDNAQFRRAQIHVAQHDTSAALETLRTLSKTHPHSPFADRSLYQIGTLLESRGRNAAAVDAYNQLLTNYPKSLLAGKARGRLRALMRTQG